MEVWICMKKAACKNIDYEHSAGDWQLQGAIGNCTGTSITCCDAWATAAMLASSLTCHMLKALR
jgi:hypothetical protein